MKNCGYSTYKVKVGLKGKVNSVLSSKLDPSLACVLSTMIYIALVGKHSTKKAKQDI